MKLVKAAIASLLILSPAGAAFAQQNLFTSPQECISYAANWDADGDGYIDQAELRGHEETQTNVDTDGDGRISRFCAAAPRPTR
jgi:hypothetical protein